MQQLQLELSSPSHALALTEEDWEGHKSVIISLYITRNLTLNHVKRILKLRYGFKAT
jgi:hypothetical protein